MQHVRVANAIGLEQWQRILHAMDSATTFHDHVSVFHGKQPLNITAELKKILDDFGTQGLKAVFAVRNNTIESFWLDSFHNYIAILHSSATGDLADFVTTLSFSGRALDA